MPSLASSPSLLRPSEAAKHLSSPNSVKANGSTRNKKRASNRRQSMATFMAIAIVLYIAGGPAKIAEFIYTFVSSTVWTNQVLEYVPTSSSFFSFVSEAYKVFSIKDKVKAKSGTLLKTPSISSFDVSYFGTSFKTSHELPVGGSDIFSCPSTPTRESVRFASRNSITLVVVSNIADLSHTSHLFASLQEFVKNANSNTNHSTRFTSIQELIIVCPSQEVIVFETLFSSLLLDIHVRFLSDEALLNGITSIGSSSQELSQTTERVLNLLVSRYVRTEFYMTLDKNLPLSKYLSYEHKLLVEKESVIYALFDPPSSSSSQSFQKTEVLWNEAERVLSAHNCIRSTDSIVSMDIFVTAPSLLSRTLVSQTVCRLRSLYGDGDQGWLSSLYRAIELMQSDSANIYPEKALYFITSTCPLSKEDERLFAKVHHLHR